MKPFEHIKQLLNVHSKERAIEVADYALQNKTHLKALMDCFFNDDLRLCQRSSWSLITIVQKNPTALQPYYQEMVDNLYREVKHDAILRNTVRVFEEINIPEEIEGKLYDKCMEFLVDPKYPIAVKAFSTTICKNIVIKYPELRNELEIVLHEALQNPISAAFSNRAKKTLLALSKLKNQSKK